MAIVAVVVSVGQALALAAVAVVALVACYFGLVVVGVQALGLAESVWGLAG